MVGALPFRRANGSVDPQQLQQAVELRHQRCTLRRIARLLLVPITTWARAMRRLGLDRLGNFDPKPPVQRYQSVEGISKGLITSGLTTTRTTLLSSQYFGNFCHVAKVAAAASTKDVKPRHTSLEFSI